MNQDTLKQAQKEIRGVLNRYGLTWQEIVPDIDEEIWNNMKSEMRTIRKQLFRKKYSRLYAKLQKAT